MVDDLALFLLVLIIALLFIGFPICTILAPGLIPVTVIGLVLGFVIALAVCFILSK